MFLRQQHSKESLFATLPDKYKVMSPADKRTLNRGEVVNQADKDLKRYSEENLVKQESKLQVKERELSLNIHERLSKLVLVTKKDENSRLLKTNHGYDDLLTFRNSIEKLKELKDGDIEQKIKLLHVEHDDTQRRKVEFSREAEADVVTMGGRVRSPEKKSVRFFDELLLEKQTKEVVDSEGNVASGLGEPPEVARFEEQDLRNTQVDTHDDKTLRRSNSTSQIGILRKTLSRNPFNLRRAATIENPSNLRRETTESDYRCQECDKTFKYRSNLKTHVLTVHNGALYRSNGTTYFNSTDDFFICDVCSQCFKYSVNLRAHKASHARSKLSSTI